MLVLLDLEVILPAPTLSFYEEQTNCTHAGKYIFSQAEKGQSLLSVVEKDVLGGTSEIPFLAWGLEEGTVCWNT